jgi:hypothetical protein
MKYWFRPSSKNAERSFTFPVSLIPTTVGWYFIIATLVLIVSYFYYPPSNPEKSWCLIKTLTGWDCPGCGLTRAFCAMAKGQIRAAARFNLFGPPLFVATLVYWSSLLLALLSFSQPLHWLEQQFHRFAKWGLLLLSVYHIFRLMGY